ncbi:MAG: hypothetical protein AAFO96_00780 [Bacteroidota bacterium]
MKITFTRIFLSFTLFLLPLLPRVSAQDACSYAENLTFTSWEQESGHFGAVGSVYRFSDVMDKTDALITIRNKYNAVITEMDNALTGDPEAFQPTVKISRQSFYGTYGYVDFEISFVQKGTTQPVQLADWRASAIDVDGDGYRLREAVGFVDCQRYTLERNTQLDVNTYNEEDHTLYFFANRQTQQTEGIDMHATEYMTYMEFANRNSFVYRASVIDDGGFAQWSEETGRMFALNFTPCLINQFAIPQTVTSQQYALVDWGELKGEVNPGRVTLAWHTSSEKCDQPFVIQRSEDGKRFERIATLLPKGDEEVSADYTFTDHNAKKGVNYYRVIQVETTGLADHSSTIEVVAEDLIQPTFTFMDNPGSNHLVVGLQAPVHGTFVVLDTQGRVFYDKTITKTFEQIDLDVSNLGSGVYWMHFETELAQRVSQAFTVK